MSLWHHNAFDNWYLKLAYPLSNSKAVRIKLLFFLVSVFIDIFFTKKLNSSLSQLDLYHLANPYDVQDKDTKKKKITFCQLFTLFIYRHDCLIPCFRASSLSLNQFISLFYLKQVLKWCQVFPPPPPPPPLPFSLFCKHNISHFSFNPKLLQEYYFLNSGCPLELRYVLERMAIFFFFQFRTKT